MEILIGMTLALGVGVGGTAACLDRDRAFYPAVTLAIGSYYILFAVLGGTAHALGLETLAFVCVAALAIFGYRTSLWMIVASLASHGLFDVVHPRLIANPGVPDWWPGFCASYDVTAALYLAWLLKRSPLATTDLAVGHPVLPYVQAELAAAAASASDPAKTFERLERAHVLSQSSTREHVRVHCHMLMWGLRQRSITEVGGQLLRIAGAATKTAFGLVPAGNTGGANVSPFKSMPIPADLADILASVARSSPKEKTWREMRDLE